MKKIDILKREVAELKLKIWDLGSHGIISPSMEHELEKKEIKLRDEINPLRPILRISIYAALIAGLMFIVSIQFHVFGIASYSIVSALIARYIYVTK